MTNRCFLGNIDFTLHKCEKRDGVDVAPLGNRAAITRCKWDENRNILKVVLMINDKLSGNNNDKKENSQCKKLYPSF